MCSLIIPRRWRTAFLALAGALAAPVVNANPTPDIVVYGATPGGIAAAISAAKGGHAVLLAEPSARIGGMTTGGLSHPDFRSFEALSGTYLELTRRSLAYYRDTYGAGSAQVRDSFRGTHAEPKVNLMLFERMLAEWPSITVRTQWELADARTRGVSGDRWIESVRFRDGEGRLREVSARLFIDGTYEGDLIAAAQVEYRIGCEGREEYGESLAPAQGSRAELQGYNLRLTMTRDPANRVLPACPPGYRAEDFSPLLALFAAGRLERVVGSYGDSAAIIKAQIPRLPNGKHDMNDVSHGPVRLSLPGEQLLWPEGDSAVRQRIYDEHLRWNVGLLYYMQNDPAVPARLREEARQWGLCRDEFAESDHVSPKLYVREARRMVGRRIFTQHDTRHAEGDARAILHPDAVAIGDYGHSSHGTWHEGSRFGGTRHGEGFGGQYRVAPYQIPYDTMVPRDVRNLLAPVPVSASHIGFCAIRLEPIWSSLGQAAGHAAHLAAGESVPDVRRVNVARLQDRLHTDGSATIYVTDVPPEHPDFMAVQWWGLRGGLHGLNPRPEGQILGARIEGQHGESWLNHSVELERPLDAATVARWTEIARRAGILDSLPQTDGRATRGDFIRTAFGKRKSGT